VHRKKSSEEIMKKLICHGKAMGKLDDSIDNTMLGGDMSLKVKIEKGRKMFVERKSFKEKKEELEAFFTTKVETMMENRKIMMSAEQRKELNALNRKRYRELKFKIDTCEWTLVKLLSGKTKAVIVKEDDKYKNLGLEEN
jgi:hypothetical protein